MATTDKQTLLHNIFEGLRINMKLSEELSAALDEERAAIRAMDTPALFRLSRRKEQLLAKILYVDESLKEMVDDLSAFSGAGRPDKGAERQTPARRLSCLTDLLSREQREFIETYTTTFKKLRLEIMEKNAVNKRFTKDTLDCISDAIALISRPEPKNEQYAVPPGAAARPPAAAQPAFISREV